MLSNPQGLVSLAFKAEIKSRMSFQKVFPSKVMRTRVIYNMNIKCSTQAKLWEAAPVCVHYGSFQRSGKASKSTRREV